MSPFYYITPVILTFALQVLQGIASILYHVCPNTITKGIDVIPMQAMCILGAMKLFRSAFPCHWLYINSIIMTCQLVVMFCLTSWNLLNIQKKVTAIVGLTLLVFVIALVSSSIKHGRKKLGKSKYKDRETDQPTPLCFGNSKRRIIRGITIILCLLFAFWAGYC